jgi:predicted HicB family RNase H-like nuclease
MGKYTEAQARAVKKYLDNIGETKVRAPKEDMKRYREAAEEAGVSLNQYFIEAIEEKISRL